jgi:hypothetical protein
MKILERQVQKLAKCVWQEYSEFEKKNQEIESRLGGFPAKKHYGFISGRDIVCMVVWQREWESHEVMRNSYEKLRSDSKPELKGVISPVQDEWLFHIAMD